MKASPISCDETRARRRWVTLSFSPSFTGLSPQTRSATNSRIASATLTDAAIPATQAANEEPVPSAWSHIVRKPVTTIVPGVVNDVGEPECSCFWTLRGSKGSAIAATNRLAFPSK